MESNHINNAASNERYDSISNILNAFLQRTEVRLSTMHRIAGVFLNGAGLLILFPVIFSEAGRVILERMLVFETIFHFWQYPEYNKCYTVIWILNLIPIVFIPLYSIYLLLMDLIHFYFVSYTPGETDLTIPRFSLSGISVPLDVGDACMAEIKKYQLASKFKPFLLSGMDFKKIEGGWWRAKKTNLSPEEKTNITPLGRRLKELVNKGILQKVEGSKIETKYVATYVDSKGISLTNEYEERDSETTGKVENFFFSYGLTGFTERNLIEEAAKSEVSIIRHANNLRKIVLRYIKALLICIWSSLIILLISASVTNLGENNYIIIYLFSIFWSLFSTWIVYLPFKWIKDTSEKEHRDKTLRDSQLYTFEQTVRYCSVVNFGLCMFGIFSFLSK